MLYLILAGTGGKKRGLPAPPLFSTNTNFALYNSFSAYSCINTYEDERAFELDENGIVAGFNCAGEPEGHQSNTGSQRPLTDVELVDPKGYLLRVSVWTNDPEVFEVNRKIRMYNVQVNTQYQRGEVSDYSGWVFGSSVPQAQLPREVFVLQWAQSS